MWVPLSRVFAALDLIAPDSTGHAIKRTASTTLLSMPKLMLTFVQMLKALSQIITILDSQSDQKRLEALVFRLDNLETSKVRGQSFRTSADRAQRAKQVFFAEMRRMETHLIHGEKVAKKQVIATTLNPARNHLMIRVGLHILGHVEAG